MVVVLVFVRQKGKARERRTLRDEWGGALLKAFREARGGGGRGSDEWREKVKIKNEAKNAGEE